MNPPGDIFRELLSLPINKGGIGVVNPIIVSIEQHSASKSICASLVNLLLSPDTVAGYAEIVDYLSSQWEIKNQVIRDNRERTVERAKSLRQVMDPSVQRSMDLASEKGASVWLSTLPIEANGFALNKSAFRDALCLRYGWSFKDSPSLCSCGDQFTMAHLLSCPTGGFPSIRHNELRDITATLLSEICSNVSIEPRLQPLTGESLD